MKIRLKARIRLFLFVFLGMLSVISGYFSAADAMRSGVRPPQKVSRTDTSVAAAPVRSFQDYVRYILNSGDERALENLWFSCIGMDSVERMQVIIYLCAERKRNIKEIINMRTVTAILSLDYAASMFSMRAKRYLRALGADSESLLAMSLEDFRPYVAGGITRCRCVFDCTDKKDTMFGAPSSKRENVGDSLYPSDTAEPEPKRPKLDCSVIDKSHVSYVAANVPKLTPQQINAKRL